MLGGTEQVEANTPTPMRSWDCLLAEVARLDFSKDDLELNRERSGVKEILWKR